MRAKFRVSSITAAADKSWAAGSVKLTAVSGGTDEDKAFHAATPTGSLEMSLREAPLEWFRDRLGQPIYLEFTAAE